MDWKKLGINESVVTEWLNDLADDAYDQGFRYTYSKTHPEGHSTYVFQHPIETHKTLVINDGPEDRHKSWQYYDRGKVVDQGSASSNQDWFLDRINARPETWDPWSAGKAVPSNRTRQSNIQLKPRYSESIQEKEVGKPSPGKGGKKPNPDYAPPELPTSLDPASVHSYYMSMADYHDKRAWMSDRLSSLKPLWSSSRNQLSDKHQFHRAMRDGFAQKALAVDLAAPMDGQAGFKGMKESVEPLTLVVDPSIHTLEKFFETYGLSKVQDLVEGNLQISIGNVRAQEAFSGIAPTGSLNAVNQNRTGSSKPPQMALRAPFPTQVQSKAPQMNLKMPNTKMAMAHEAVASVADGADANEILNKLLR